MARVNTVLGPVDADSLGVVASHDALLSIYPGAQYAFDVSINRAEIFSTLKHKIERFKAVGGGTIVDSTGMFHGRDVYLYEALQESTGVNIVASTGQGPEALLGGYFLTPQTNPPTPWPAEKFAELFAAEVAEGMVVPRIERRAGAGLITTAGTRSGLTPTDQSLFMGAARAAKTTGAAMSFRFGADPIAELQLVLDEGIEGTQVRVSGIDADLTHHTLEHVHATAQAIARAGAFIGIDNVGTTGDDYRIRLIRALIDDGLTDRILIASGSTGVALAHEDNGVSFTHIIDNFAPALRDAGISEADIQTLTTTNPATWLAQKQ